MGDSFFSYDGTFFSILNRIADIIILNVLWFICCIPVVTIGASTTALLYVTMKILNGEDAYVAKKFFKSLKENFLQSTVMWILMLIIGIVLFCNFLFLPGMNVSDSVYTIFFSATCLSTLIYGMILVYLFALQAKLENKIKDTFKNAVLLSFRHLPTTILLLLLVVVPAVLIWKFFTTLALALVLFAGSGIGLLCSMLYNRIFSIYIKPEYEEIQEDSAGTDEEHLR